MKKFLSEEEAVRVHLLGPPRWQSRDGTTRRLSAKDAALIAVVALDGPQPRDRLTSMLWPSTSLASARNSLRQRAFRLRRAAGSHVIHANELVQLAPEVQIDVHIAFSSEERLLAALQSDLLNGVDSEIPDSWNDWLRARRDRFSASLREAVLARITHHEHNGDLAQAIGWARRLIDGDPLSEFSWRRLMQLHCARGDRAAALATYDQLERVIREELGTHPDEETLNLMRAIEASALVTGHRRSFSIPDRLMHPPTLIGRQNALNEIGNAWACKRLAWIDGQTGSGKSRLLEELALQPGILLVQLVPADGSAPGATLHRLVNELGRPHITEVMRSGHENPEPHKTHSAVSLLAHALNGAGAAGLKALLIDDFQHTDSDSLTGLAQLLPSLLGSDLGVAVAVTTASDIGRLRLFRRTFADRHELAPIRLPMLDQAQMVQLVQTVEWQTDTPEAVADLLTAHTGGNPWFALETLKAIHLRRKLGTPGALNPEQWPSIVPNAVLDSCRATLNGLEPSQRALARLACRLGDEFTIEHAAELMCMHPMHLIDAWAVLESSGICTGRRISSTLMHKAVQSLTPEELFEEHLKEMNRQHRIRISDEDQSI